MELAEIILSELPTLRTKAGHVISTRELLNVDEGNLNEEIMRHATHQGFIAFQHAEAVLEASRASRRIKQLRAAKRFYYLENIEALFSVKATSDNVDAAIERDPEIIKSYDDLAVIEHRENVFYALREAFLARKDALVHLSADERLERRMRPTD